MGITNDQITRGALERLRFHYEQLVELQEVRRVPGEMVAVTHARYDAQAWGFAKTLTSSEKLEGVLRDLCRGYREGKTIEELSAENDRCNEEYHDNEPDPRLGLETLELLVRGYGLLSAREGDIQWSDVNGVFDAEWEIDRWLREKHLLDALRFIPAETLEEWGGYDATLLLEEEGS